LIDVRATQGADLPRLSELFAQRFGHPLSAEEWRWKYEQLPGEGRSRVAVGPGGALLAHGGALRLPARWRGGEAGIWQLVDFVAAAGGRGLSPPLVELGRCLLAGLPGEADAPWIFGFPSERHFRLGERVFGYRPLATVEVLAGPLPQPAGGAEEALAAAARIESGDSCGDWAEQAWEACGLLGVRRSRDFLNWRYHARPARYYRFYRLLPGAEGTGQSGSGASGAGGSGSDANGAGGSGASGAGGSDANGAGGSGDSASGAGATAAGGDGGGACGLAVFAFVGEEAWAAELWLPASGEWYAAMLAVAADLRASGLRSWRFWPPPAAGGPLLGALGLRPTGERRSIGCRGRPGDPDPAAAAAGFYYAMGDYDLV
jgi:hypothetical protein